MAGVDNPEAEDCFAPVVFMVKLRVFVLVSSNLVNIAFALL